MSPGMKYKHYSPETKCKLVACENELDQLFYMKKVISEFEGKIVIIGCNEHEEKLGQLVDAYLPIGPRNDLDEYARNIFTALRYADNLKCNLILIEGVRKYGFGIAIMNRLLRTCEYDVIER